MNHKFRTNMHNVSHFQCCIFFNWLRNSPSKSVTAAPNRAKPGRFITDINKWGVKILKKTSYGENHVGHWSATSRVAGYPPNHWGWRLRGHFHPMKSYNVDIKPQSMSCITHTLLAWHQQIVSTRFVSTFHLRLKPWSQISSLRYSVPHAVLRCWPTMYNIPFGCKHWCCHAPHTKNWTTETCCDYDYGITNLYQKIFIS